MVGGRRERRQVNGVLLLDKPRGLSSNGALQLAKRLFQARKVGHTGSLDPSATGLLPLCFGEATKICGFLLDTDKYYWTRIQLGVKTNTGDADGEVVYKLPVPPVSVEDLELILARFRGPIMQIPPMFSAVKKNGKELYKFAHQGIDVEREARPVVIHNLHLVKIDADCLELTVRCSKGTFIRTLAEDLGEVLGCGAHVADLRRLGVGSFTAEQMVTAETLQQLAENGVSELDALLLPTQAALDHWPTVTVTEEMAFFLLQGQSVLVPKTPANGYVRLFKGESCFLGMGKVLDDGRVAAKRLIRA